MSKCSRPWSAAAWCTQPSSGRNPIDAITGNPPQTLRRSLGYWDLILYGLAYIAPIAPLTTLGYVWSASHGLIALAYLVGAVCMYFTAKSYAVMSVAVPSAGSVYGFARFALGTLPGFISGWMILLDYLLIPAFVYVMIAVAMETLVPGVSRPVWIVLMVLSTLGINWFGVTMTARANLVAVIAQILVVLIFLVLGVVALMHGKGNGALTLHPFFQASNFNIYAVFTATSICVMSFLGFDAISTLSEEVEGNDQRLVARAIIGVLVISSAFFVVVAWVLGNLLPGLHSSNLDAAPYELAGWAIGAWAAVALAWCYAIIVGVSNALPMQVGVARVLFAMGRDRQLPHVLSRIHPRYHTPYVGMLVTAVLSLTVAMAMRNMLDQLATIVNFGALSGFLLLHVSVLVYFGRQQRSNQWFVHYVSPILGIAVVCAVMSQMSLMATVVGLGWLAIGIVWGLVLRARNRIEISAAL